jgi:hypothetical protein
MTPDEELDRLDQELDRLQTEYPKARGFLRLSNSGLRSCSKWKWETHGWAVSEGDSCGIMNGDEKARRTALLSVLKARMIDRVEFVSDLDVLNVLPEPPCRP